MNDTFASQSTDVEVDVRVLLKSLARALPYLIFVVGLITVGTFVGLQQLAPKYRAEATVLIETGESEFTRSPNAPQTGNEILDQEAVASQVQLFNSRDLARRVAQRLNLGSRVEFDPALKGSSFVSNILAAIGLGKDPLRSSAEERVLEQFAKRLSVYSIPLSRVIVVEVNSEDPELAADAANAVVEEYIALQRDAKRDMTEDATKWLESEIESLRVRVQEAEATVETYRSTNGLFTGGGQTPATLPQQELSDLSAELTRVRGARAEAQAKADQIRAGLNSGAALNQSEVLNSPLIQRLVEQQIALRTQIAQLSATLLPEHPRMRELSAQITDLDRQILREAQKILKGLEAEAGYAEAREAEIQQNLGKLKSTAARANDAEVDLRALEREASAQRELLDSYLRRYRDALSRQQGDYLPADARIISRAAVPIEPHFPNKPALTAAATIASLLVGIAIILIRELASGRSTRRVMLRPPPPPDVAEPTRWDEDLAVRRIMHPRQEHGEGTDRRTAKLLLPVAGQIVADGYKRVMMVSVGASARPAAAVALARAIARHDCRPVLIDLRGDEANSDSLGGGTDLPGFSDLLAGNASFAQVIFRDRQSRVHFIPRGLDPLATNELAEENVGMFLDALDHTYDHVILDVADEAVEPLGPGCDAVVLATEFDLADARTVAAFERIGTTADAKIILLPLGPDADPDEEEEAEGAAA